MMLVCVIVLASIVNLGRTPEEAVTHVLYPSPHTRFVVERVNVVGRYATVLTRGGMMEGSAADDAAILFERFSFGWQALESLNFRCRLDEHPFSPHTKRLLMRGMPRPQKDRPCDRVRPDVGPSKDVEALRRQAEGAPLVPYVAVVGRFALVGWYGAGGGDTLFKRRGSAWTVVGEGGGAQDMQSMREHGVPRAAWCVFRIHDADCPLKR